MTRTLVPFLVVIAVAARAHAQEQPAPDLEGRRINAEATAHAEAGRHALAADSFMALHAHMLARGNPRAPVALWNAGFELAQVSGGEREARDTIQRFLGDSNALAGDPDVADLRSRALARVADLDRRLAGTGDSAPARTGGSGGGAISGPIVLGIGGAALVAGVIIGSVVLVRDDELTSMCPDGRCPDQAALNLAAEVEQLALTADILVTAGAIFAATGILLMIFLRDEAPPPASAACTGDGCFVRIATRF